VEQLRNLSDPQAYEMKLAFFLVFLLSSALALPVARFQMVLVHAVLCQTLHVWMLVSGISLTSFHVIIRIDNVTDLESQLNRMPLLSNTRS
jgi:Na+/glutamate symporter